MRPALLALLAVFAWASPAWAQSATVSMSVDRDRVQLGDVVRLTVQVQMEGVVNAQVAMPDVGAFDVVQRQVSRPFTMRLGTAAGTQVQASEVHVLGLRPRQEGTFEIAPASVTLGGRQFQSSPVTVIVGAGVAPATPTTPSAAPPGASPGVNQQQDGMRFDPQAFLRTWVDPAEPVVGQQVTVSVYLYANAPLRGSPALTQEPSAAGFWVQDLLPRNRRLDATQQEVSGRLFYVYLIRRFAAFPLRAGELTIGAPRVEVRQARSIFGSLGGGTQMQREGVPVQIQVAELPEAGRPTGDVHVGSLRLSAEIDRAQVATGDAISLSLTATGQGPVEQLRLPRPDLDGLRVHEPEVDGQTRTNGAVIEGTRRVRFLIVPERPGRFTLGPFEVPTFNPVTRQYGVARAAAITLEASGAAVPVDVADTSSPTPASSNDAAQFGPVRTESALRRSYGSIVDAPWFGALYGIGPFALLLGLLVRRRQKTAGRPDPKGAPKRARKAAEKRLATAKTHAGEDAPREFYAAVSAALKEVLEARLGQAVGSLTFPEMRRVLEARGMDTELVGGVVDELEGCDFARFSAVGVSRDEMNECLDRARGLLAKIDRFSPTAEEPA
ncbi:MAG: BatD family protein [Sandaracinaceae bacterium]